MIVWGHANREARGLKEWVLVAAMLLAPAMPAHAQSTAAAIAPAVGANVLGEYRINPGDELDVSVWGEERMQRTVRVLSDGTFAFPLAGTIVAANRTVNDVSSTIRERIAGNYRTSVPDVTVGVRAAADMTFFVVGKVRTPGTYASSRAVNAVQALSMAGGLAEFADVNNAVILRQTPHGQVVEPIKLAKVLKGKRQLEAGALSNPLPILRSGDVLVIP